MKTKSILSILIVAVITGFVLIQAFTGETGTASSRQPASGNHTLTSNSVGNRSNRQPAQSVLVSMGFFRFIPSSSEGC